MTDTVTAEVPTESVQLPSTEVPTWVNSLMTWMLSTPGIQALVGRGVALLTFGGRRSGKRYTIPVSYQRDDNIVTVVTKRQRNWWRNFETPADVELRLAGREFTGKAEAKTDEIDALEFMRDFLEKRPIDAKAYGLARDQAGRIASSEVAKILPHIVVIRISIAPDG